MSLPVDCILQKSNHRTSQNCAKIHAGLKLIAHKMQSCRSVIMSNFDAGQNYMKKGGCGQSPLNVCGSLHTHSVVIMQHTSLYNIKRKMLHHYYQSYGELICLHIGLTYVIW